MKLSARQRAAHEEAEIAAGKLALEAYQSAEKQETPDASHLEALVKQDIEAWSREVHELSSSLEAVKGEYESIKVELRDAKQDQSTRSMFIAIEGRVTEAANKLEAAVQNLEQNLKLLERAIMLNRLEVRGCLLTFAKNGEYATICLLVCHLLVFGCVAASKSKCCCPSFKQLQASSGEFQARYGACIVKGSRTEAVSILL